MSDVQDVQEAEVQLQSETEPQDTASTKFTDYPFADSILQDIAAAGYERPTPIQAACIPASLEGKDIIGLAQTGTGKTAAFALPIIQKLAQSTDLAALVLTPTRELAMQVTGVFNQLGKSSGVRVATIVGGIPMDNDYKALRSWPSILVATPGRLIDHLTYRSISLKEIQMLVVDEADRMHDMGFIPQIRRILDELPTNRQTLMFTATMPKDVERIARMSMKDPVRIQVGMQVPVEGATQQLFRVSDDEKGPLLLRLLGESENRGRVLVFVRTKRGCDKLHRIVCRRFHAARIHGDREQIDRDDAMGGFREGRYRILIATDIAARGIDVADIEHVINYDFPLSAEDYVHRIGRTARQQATGLATSFVTSNDRRFLLDAYKLLGDRLPLTDDLKELVDGGGRYRSGPSRSGGSRGGNGRDHGRGGRSGDSRSRTGRSSARDHDGAGRSDARPAISNHEQSHPVVEAQPKTEVVLHHREGDDHSQPGDSQEGGRRRRRGRGGRGRSSQPGQPHASHSGNRAEAPKEIREPAPAKSPDEPPAKPRRQPPRDDSNDGGVVILDRCEDGYDGIVGEEGRRGSHARRGGRRPAGRRRSGGGKKPETAGNNGNGSSQ